jgi:hypothetical protein
VFLMSSLHNTQCILVQSECARYGLPVHNELDATTGGDRDIEGPTFN